MLGMTVSFPCLAWRGMRPYCCYLILSPNVRHGHIKVRLAILNFWCESWFQNRAGALSVRRLHHFWTEMCHVFCRMPMSISQQVEQRDAQDSAYPFRFRGSQRTKTLRSALAGSYPFESGQASRCRSAILARCKRMALPADYGVNDA